MTDMEKREKVIWGLECCIKRNPDDKTRCGECPYDGACLNRLKADALALLKAQEPMKPVAAIDNVGDWLCGNCYQSVIGIEELDASGFLQVKYNYCPNCGRAVKWK